MKPIDWTKWDIPYVRDIQSIRIENGDFISSLMQYIDSSLLALEHTKLHSNSDDAIVRLFMVRRSFAQFLAEHLSDEELQIAKSNQTSPDKRLWSRVAHLRAKLGKEALLDLGVAIDI